MYFLKVIINVIRVKKISLLSINIENEKKLIEYKKSIFKNYNIESSFLFINALILSEESYKDKLEKFPSELEFESKISYKNGIAYLKLKTKLDFINFKYVDGLAIAFTDKKLPALKLNKVNSINYQEAMYELDNKHSSFSIIYNKHLSKEFRK